MDSAQARLEFAIRVHEYLTEFVRSADQKAGFFLVVAGAQLAWLVTTSTSAHLLTQPYWVLVAATLALIATAASATWLVVAVWPQQQAITTGLISFAGILRTGTQTDYVKQVADADAVEELSNHSYGLARVVRTKYARLQVAVWLLAGAAGLSSIVVAYRLFGPTG